MEIREFADEDYPALVAVHSAQGIAWPERPRTPEAWAEADRRRDPQHKHRRWVALENGDVVGVAGYAGHPWNYPPGSFYIAVEVLPAYQRRGIGSALYDQLMVDIRELAPPALRADAFSHLPHGFEFLKKRGFFEAFRETPVRLDVAAFDPGPHARAQARPGRDGIEIKTVAELQSDPDRDRKLYELYCAIEEDVPHEGEGIPKPEYDDWLKWGLNDPDILQDAYLVAVDGDEYVGLRELFAYPDDRTLMGGLLGVRRDYRKQGIALALQLRGIEFAREHGYRFVKDCTAIQNAPMQAMFDRLGFDREAEWLQCQKDL